MIELIGSALAIIASLGGTIAILVKYNWKLKQKADEAQNNYTSYVLTDLKMTVDKHALALEDHGKVMTKVDKDLNGLGRKVADVVERIQSLVAHAEVTNQRVNHLEKDFGKIIIRGEK